MKRKLRVLIAAMLVSSMCVTSQVAVLAEDVPDADVETVDLQEDADTVLDETDVDDARTDAEGVEADEADVQEETGQEAQLAEGLDIQAEQESAEMPEPLIADGIDTYASEDDGMMDAYAAPFYCTSEEWEVLRLVNKERMQKGLNPLSTYEKLQDVCDVRAEELVTKFDHTRPNGSDFSTVLKEGGISYNAAGENIAAGYATPNDVMSGWMNSPGHRANILGSQWTHIGVGYKAVNKDYRYYWVQVFTGYCKPTKITVQDLQESDVLTLPYGASLDSLGLTLELACEHGNSYLPLTAEMCKGFDPSKTGTEQTITVSYANSDVALETTFKVKVDTTVSYRTHVQSHGWKDWVQNGAMSGTTGEAKRLEAIKIKIEGQGDLSGKVEYRTHIQSIGWKEWVESGGLSGTEGKAKRLEAIQIRLTEQLAEKYDIYYRVHAQTFGWMGWAKNGAYAGTAGYAKRLEGIEIRLVEKGEKAPTSDNENTAEAYKHPMLQYQTHVQTHGWQSWAKDGEMSGTEGQAKRLEGIHIQLCNQEYEGDIQYRTHVQTDGWEDEWKKNGDMSGTEGQAKRLEAIQIKLTGEMAEKYDVYYQVHAQTFGWMGWAKNGDSAGTAGYAKRLEGIRIQIVPKNGPAPGSTENAFKDKGSVM